DAANLARLQETQELHLDVLVELADFVEEQRAAVGHLEQALVIAVGAGEGALAMAEQLALHQVLGQGAAVDWDERHLRPLALLKERARGQLLAGASLTQDH